MDGRSHVCYRLEKKFFRPSIEQIKHMEVYHAGLGVGLAEYTQVPCALSKSEILKFLVEF